MAHNIEFTKSDTVNKIDYKKGDKASVSKSIYDALKSKGSIKDSKKTDK